MKLFSILVFAVHGVYGLRSETTVGNHQQSPPYIFDGKVITNAEQYAEAKLDCYARFRGSSADSFVKHFDSTFSVMYRFELPNAREYLKAVWDCWNKNGRVGTNVNSKDVFAKLGMPEEKAIQAKQMIQRLHPNDKTGFFTMIESLLFVHGNIPFAEYSAILKSATGTSNGPPERNLSAKVYSELKAISQQRPTHRQLYKRFEQRFNDFLAVFHHSGKRSAEEAPGPAPAAKRARPTAACQDAESSFQKLLCEHARFQEEIASLKTELQTKNQEIGGLKKMCDHHNLVSAKLQSELQSKDQHHQKCQAELRAEFQRKIDALTAQNQQLQQENAALRQQRPPVVIKTEPGIKQEVKKEHFFDIKPKPQQ